MGGGAAKFGPEVSAHGSIRTAFGLSGTTHVGIFKYGVAASSIAKIAGQSAWQPAANEILPALMTFINAAKNSTINGEAVEIVGLVWNQGETEALATVDWPTAVYEEGIRSLLAYLRLQLALPALRCAIFGVHGGYVLTTEQRARLTRIGAAQFQVGTEPPNGYRPTFGFTLLPDATHFDVAGTVAFGNAVGPAIVSAPLAPEALPAGTVRPKICILAGQSNAEGHGLIADLPARLLEPFAEVNTFDFRIMPFSPFAPLEAGVNNISTGSNGTLHGPELTMAETWRRQNPGETLWLAKYAVDGSALGTGAEHLTPWSWAPDLQAGLFLLWTFAMGETVYWSTASSGNIPAIVDRFVWIQGDTDAIVAASAEIYGERLKAFWRICMRRLAQTVGFYTTLSPVDEYAPPPFIIVRPHKDIFMGQPSDANHVVKVRAAMEKFVEENSFAALVDTDDLVLSDGVHYDSASLQKLGQRVMEAAPEQSLRPLFNTTWATLMQRLRLTGVPADGDATYIIRSALVDSRAFLLLRIGRDRVFEVKRTELSNEPVTDAQILRVLAAKVEVDMMRFSLLRRLKALFADGSDGNAVRQLWNEVALGRGMGPFDVEKELKRLELDIESSVRVLQSADLTRINE
ncbi:MAG: sialate O-acetylesterase, partial [Actinomycetota bacterium]